MKMEDRIKILLKSDIGALEVDAVVFRFAEGTYRKALFAVNKAFEADAAKHGKDIVITELYATNTLGYGDTVAEAIGNAAERLEKNAESYRNFRRLCKNCLEGHREVRTETQRGLDALLSVETQYKEYVAKASTLPVAVFSRGAYRIRKSKEIS